MPTAKPEQYLDNRGVSFSEVRYTLPAHIADWPRIARVKQKGACEFMHDIFGRCWNCGQSSRWFGDHEHRVQAHHIFEGSRGKSEELANIAMLCPGCHGQLTEPIIPLGRILYLKWKHDWLHCDWTRCALLHGRFLPDLIVD